MAPVYDQPRQYEKPVTDTSWFCPYSRVLTSHSYSLTPENHCRGLVVLDTSYANYRAPVTRQSLLNTGTRPAMRSPRAPRSGGAPAGLSAAAATTLAGLRGAGPWWEGSL
ncbi:hypothetical protein H920_01947 [Fukomys damarensis]|uniref:Uncharacterized protein n=1 Tax=Fukomys damarensis TaxID=885580 RepID=A0A091EMB6_FUKDA|nr:hypothetical protein H920_01947 [Fukomys damarensis]